MILQIVDMRSVKFAGLLQQNFNVCLLFALWTCVTSIVWTNLLDLHRLPVVTSSSTTDLSKVILF